MYASINQWAFDEGMPVTEMLRAAKRLGFDAFEPAISAHGELSLDSADAEFIAFREEAERLGMRLTALASGLSWGCSPTSNRPEVREKAHGQAVRQLECAALLGVDAVLFVPGTVGTGFWGGEDDPVDYTDAWDRAVSELRALAPVAEKLGVVIGVENVWNNLLLSPKDMTSLLDEVDNPYVRTYLDVGNTVKYGFPEMYARALAGRIIRVHVKDYHRADGTLNGFCDPLEGDADFPAVMRELRAAGYDLDMTIELAGKSALSGEERLRHVSDALRVILNMK